MRRSLQPGSSGSASIFFLDLPFHFDCPSGGVREHAPFFATHGELDGRHRAVSVPIRASVLSLEEAVRKMTSLAADHFGLTKRGRLVPGAFADLVLGPEYAIFFAALAS
jgi:predicted amidohydrolase YtcJ